MKVYLMDQLCKLPRQEDRLEVEFSTITDLRN
jgi:hypothetical protein